MDILEKQNKQQSTQVVGESGERLAEEYLIKKGFTLIERNFHSRNGEIDLIMRDKDCLVFVEVRQRKNALFGTPLETINYSKQNKLRLTAQYYCLTRNIPSSQSMRFDAIGIVADSGQNSIEWVANAF